MKHEQMSWEDFQEKLRVLNQSIHEKWRRVVFEGKWEEGSSDCACCQYIERKAGHFIFNFPNDLCSRFCPIAIVSGRYCTVSREWASYMLEHNKSKHKARKNAVLTFLYTCRRELIAYYWRNKETTS